MNIFLRYGFLNTTLNFVAQHHNVLVHYIWLEMEVRHTHKMAAQTNLWFPSNGLYSELERFLF